MEEEKRPVILESTNRLRELLIKHEGLRQKVYDDANGNLVIPGYTLVGHPTIGVGQALDTNGITKVGALFLLEEKLKEVTRDAHTLPWFKSISVIRQDVVICMIFSLGLSGFSAFKKMIASLVGGNFDEAANQMLLSRWSSQVKRRAVELATMMRENRYL